MQRTLKKIFEEAKQDLNSKEIELKVAQRVENKFKGVSMQIKEGVVAPKTPPGEGKGEGKGRNN